MLGIPHPPGTPLFVMLGHVWADVVALGGYAWRLNLLSAVCSAAGAGLLFLVAHRLLAGESPLIRAAGGVTGALTAAFTFTVWQNSNESEVYAIATFSICAMAWLALRWRDTRDPRHLLLVVYLAALSIGNHLLALLAGPAVLVFVALTLRGAPAPDPRERRLEWAEWMVIAAMWVLLVAVGLGREKLFWAAALLLAGALVWAVMSGARMFPAAVMVAAAIGVSTYAFLYVRAGLQPVLNEADPSTWDRLLAVIRREQYPFRSPLDNPMFLSGPGNPGRTVTLFAHQLVNYVQYFDWQWARALGIGSPTGAAGRTIMTAIFALLGYVGWTELRRRDRAGFGMLATLWLITGLGLVVYMNFKPGFSLFWEQYPRMDQHEVRERDYFFIASFQAWGLVAGMGAALLARRLGAPARRAPLALLALALVPLALNWRAATRRGPDAYIARDFAWNLLQSVGPYGILFSYGDNDTFPLWYLQEVEGVRQDVELVNLSLANTSWYLDQMRRRAARPFDTAAAPAVWRERRVPQPQGPLLVMPDSIYDQLQAFQQPSDARFVVQGIPLRLRQGQTVLPRDIAIIFLLNAHFGRRPMAFGAPAAQGEWLGLGQSLVQRGLAHWIEARPDSMRQLFRGASGGLVDTVLTRRLTEDVYRYTGLFEADTLVLDPAARQLTGSMARPWLELSQAAIVRGDQAATVEYLRRALHLMPNRQLRDLLNRIESEGLEALLRQSGGAPSPP